MVVVRHEVVESLGDRLQARRLGRRVAILRDVGAVHDPRQDVHRGVADLVLLDSTSNEQSPSRWV